MRVAVDPQRCQGHTLCAMTAPEVFELDDEDGRAHADPGRIPVEFERAARRAAVGCPEQAISILD